MEATKKKKSYELNCIFALNDGQKIANICDKISDWVNKNGGEIVSLEKTDEEGKASKGNFWVEKKYLAYAIKKNKAGFYLSVFFDAEPSNVKDLSRMLKLEAAVIRFMVTDVSGVGRKLSSGAKELSQMKEVAPVDVPQTSAAVEAPSAEVTKAEVTEEKEAVEPEIEKEAEEVVLVEEMEELKEESEAAEVEEATEKAVEEPTEEETKPEEVVSEEIPAEIEEPAVGEEAAEIEEEKTVEAEEAAPKKEKAEAEEAKKKDSKKKKISLDDLDRRLDDILNEEIL